jgi:tetraacyldisaccharide 4'-kinase
VSLHWQHALQRAWWRPGESTWSLALRPLSWLVRAVVAGRTWRQSRPAAQARWAAQRRAAGLDTCPILVVGNLIVGGAGKTPTTLALIRWLQTQGWHPGVVSRGYGRRGTALCEVTPTTPATECGDEPLLLHRRSGVPVCVNADRLAAAQRLRERHPELDVIVADDGLQHTRLPRDAQLIVFDARGIGNGHVLPAGPLRQPWPDTPPARSLVIYNADAPSTPWPGHLARRQLAGVVALSAWLSGQRPQADTLHALQTRAHTRPMLAAAGLAEPERFFTMLERQWGLRIVRHPLPDHADLSALTWPDGVDDVIVTEKDAVKLTASDAGPRIWVAPLDFELPDAVSAQLADWLAPWRPSSSRSAVP